MSLVLRLKVYICWGSEMLRSALQKGQLVMKIFSEGETRKKKPQVI